MADTALNFNEIVLDIYDSAIDPKRWPGTLTRVAEYVGGQGAFLFELKNMDGEQYIGARHFSSNYDETKVTEYLSQHQHDEMRDQLVFAHHSKKSDEIVLIGDQVLAPTTSELMDRANVRTMQKFGILHRAGALLNKDIIYKDRFAVQFTADQGPLNPDKARRSGLIMPHLAKALDIGRATMQLSEKYISLANSINFLRIGVCILDANGNVVLRNTEFDRQIDVFGTFKVRHDGRLSLNTPDEGDMFEGLVKNRIAAPFGGRPRKQAIVPSSSELNKFQCIEVMPVESHYDFGGDLAGGVVVFSIDTTKHFEFDMDTIAHIYNLTQSERAVLASLSDGHTNKAIADIRGTS
ncbi:MAG: hypothetical protein AAFO77_15225, partial [Pseudomonadota bacterium]